MKMVRKISLLAFFTGILSCGNQATEQPSQKGTDLKREDIQLCYQYSGAIGSVNLRLERKGDSLHGPLQIGLKEKDRNDGVFLGRLEDSVLRGIYTFSSEGMTSVREEVFKWRGDDLLRGYGEVLVKGDTIYYTDISRLVFDTSVGLRKIRCEDE